ncbi:MAG: tetratricopeptide repeat protein [Candidatus Omnitrophica bacterium]|nr:tetratricopeptide repeat protein [Candidatus Omnitrophota bacterium]
MSILCLLIFCGAAQAASPKRDIKEGNRHYQNGDYAASRKKYAQALEKAPESDIVNFNLGTAFYKEGDYEQSVDHLQKVLLSDNEELKKSAHYNLGNALYRSGMMSVEEDVDLAVSSLEKSLSQYERALSLDKDDKDAKHNYEYVRTELIRLKQQQQQQQDQKQCDLPKDKKDQQQQDNPSQEKQEKQEKQQQQQDESGEEEQQQQQQGESGEEEQQQQQKSGQESGQEGQEDYNKQNETSAKPQNAEELTPKEAQMLLESYQQAEEPQNLLNILMKSKDTSSVLKDW